MPLAKPTKRSTARILSRIETHKRRIAKERDALRELIGDVEAICETCDRAHDGLGDAVAALSEYL